jgi:hypothetical protein
MVSSHYTGRKELDPNLKAKTLGHRESLSSPFFARPETGR